MTGGSADGPTVDRVAVDPVGDPVRVDGPGRVDAVYRHGWQSWSASGWVAPDHPFPRAARAVDRRSADHPLVDRSAHQSCDVAALADGDDVVLLGALGHGAVVTADPDSSVLVGEAPSGVRWLKARGSEQGVFRQYAAALAAAGRARRSPGRPPRVWCSWYSFYTEVDPDLVDAVVADLGDLPFDVVQLDDGWQREIGDWQPDDRFADLGRMASSLARGGRRAGLWLAPFLVHDRADAARERSDWLVRDDDGAPLVAVDNWGGDSHALDVTRPEVVEHVCDTLRACVEAGFDYLKLDFLYAAALPGRRHDEHVDPMDAYRDAMAAIRDAVGEDTYLLGCGAPILASLGIVDGLRIGPDVAEVWDVPAGTATLGHLGHPTARYAIATSAARTWLRPLVDLDPDVVLLRSRRNQLGSTTRGMLADLARICGFVATSDPVGWLDGAERDALRGLLTEDPVAERTGRHTWTVDGRVVDLSAATAAPPGVPVPSPDPLPARLPELRP